MDLQLFWLPLPLTSSKSSRRPADLRAGGTAEQQCGPEGPASSARYFAVIAALIAAGSLPSAIARVPLVAEAAA